MFNAKVNYELMKNHMKLIKKKTECINKITPKMRIVINNYPTNHQLDLKWYYAQNTFSNALPIVIRGDVWSKFSLSNQLIIL